MTKEDKIRYSRLMAIEAIGPEGMERLRRGKVMVTGCGALGSLCAMYLAGSGIGTIGIADFDTIDISNLQRQLFFSEADAGERKAEILHRRMSNLNSGVSIKRYDAMITAEGASGIYAEYDFIIDATDNPRSKFMTDSVCRKLGKAYCIGGVRDFSGQVMSWAPGHTPYGDIFTAPECEGGFTPCSIGGVAGPAAGVISSIQASEAIKYMAGCSGMLFDRLFVIDLLSMKSEVIRIND